MDYFAGLDVSMEETYLCVVDRDGVVTAEAKVSSTPEAIIAALAKVPTCRRVVLETGRMVPMPGAILLMAGTNDVKQGVPQATIIANLTRMIDMIANANPSTHVYLSLLLPLGPGVPNGAMIP